MTDISNSLNIIINLIARELNIAEKQVLNTIKLFNDGCTIPFISRYRKEFTNGLDEIQIGDIQDFQKKYLEIQKRKELIIKTIKEKDLLDSVLLNRINECWNATELEDIYLPFKPRKRTRADIARENGLEPLAKMIMKQNPVSVEKLASGFLNNSIQNTSDALKGACDIIAEWVNESETARNSVRRLFTNEAFIYAKLVKGKEEEGQKYRDYFNFNEKLSKCSSHRLLAVRRGEEEGFLKVSIYPDEEKCLERLEKIFIKADNESAELVFDALEDAYKRLLKPAIENEFASSSKLKADTEAIRVFAENLRQLLLMPALGEFRTLGIDPGYRTGCKIVCLDAQGNLLHNETIFPHPPQNDYAQSVRKIQKIVEAYNIQAIAIGNGTAGRETEKFIQNIRYDREVKVFVVSENGASVYSASKIARDEFPDYDVTVRGAVSIGRRLMDPLAELVKIDPKSIGVGQYQHDVDQNLLKNALDQTVINAVNKVGVNLNTASKHLLTYISGLGPQIAQNIVDYRTEIGSFRNRKQLLKVSKMGPKTYEQCAGFLRIPDGDEPLDNSAVHPESYHLVKKMSADQHLVVKELIRNKDVISKIDLNKYVTENIGLPTLKDILVELEKPGRDPREKISEFEFSAEISKIQDLKIDMELPGIVTNVTNFGAFVDIGIKENGLIHISQLSDTYVSNPALIVSLHQHVKVRVIELDQDRKRIQLKLLKK
jgi:uncharacterized protein